MGFAVLCYGPMTYVEEEVWYLRYQYHLVFVTKCRRNAIAHGTGSRECLRQAFASKVCFRTLGVISVNVTVRDDPMFSLARRHATQDRPSGTGQIL